MRDFAGVRVVNDYMDTRHDVSVVNDNADTDGAFLVFFFEK